MEEDMFWELMRILKMFVNNYPRTDIFVGQIAGEDICHSMSCLLGLLFCRAPLRN